MDNALNRSISTGMLVKFAMPTIVSMIFMGIYTTVDGVFVSRLVGTDALSAVNIIMPLISVSMAIGAMFGSGGSAIVARKMGEGKDSEARRNFAMLMAVAFGVSALAAALGLAFLKPLIRFLGADESLFQYCWDYGVATLALLPFTSTAMAFQVFFIVAGKARLGLWVSVLGGVCNIVLDYVFIAAFDMGIRGAAIATGIGYSVLSAFGCVYFLANKKGNLFFERPVADWRVVTKACSNGASEMVSMLSMGIVTLLLNKLLMWLAGPDGVAAITIILYAQGLLSSAYLGYALGIAPVISYNYGRQDTDRLKRVYSISLRLILATSVATFLLSLLFADALVAIFAPQGAKVFDMAVRGYRLFSVCFLFMGFNVFSSAMFTALSDGRVSAVLSFFRTLVFVVAAALIMPLFMGVDGVWVAIPLAELLGLVMTGYYFAKLKPVYHYA